MYIMYVVIIEVFMLIGTISPYYKINLLCYIYIYIYIL